MAKIVRSNDKINEMINGGEAFPSVGFKNYIINGGFDIWQRGESFSDANGIYIADRWVINQSGDWTVSKENGCKITAGATPTFLYLNTRIEQPYKLSNKELTFSFKMACQNGSRDIRIRHRRSGEASHTIEEIAIDASDTRYSVSFTALDMDALTASDDYYQIEILIGDSNTVNAGDEFTIQEVQLEEGSVATPFEQRPYGLELSLCQRYYQDLSSLRLLFYGMRWSNNTLYDKVALPCAMRTIPTIQIGQIGIVNNDTKATESGNVVSASLSYPKGGSTRISFMTDGFNPVSNTQYLLRYNTSDYTLTLDSEL